MSNLSANDVASFILENKSNYQIDPRKLQKLLYLCQGLYLAREGEILFEDKIEAWDFGPVCRDIYYKLKKHRYHPLPADALVGKNKLGTKAASLVLAVISTFGIYTKGELIEFTHIDAPWASKYVQYANTELNSDDLKSYFSNFDNFSEYINYQKERIMFKSYIKDRRTYLKGLSSLGDNWLSSYSVSPNEMTTDLASKILSTVRNLVNHDVSSPTPKLIMGPIPSGGVGIEFVINEGKRLFVNIYNNEVVEFDVENDGYFTEYDSTLSETLSKFKELYKEVA